jgi:exodeoxyribonuclease VII large subunit
VPQEPDPELFGPTARRQAVPAATAGNPGESAEAPLRVDDLAHMLRAVVGGSFPPLWVAGEVTQFTRHRNGHWYFSLKGAQASLRCVMWASQTWRVPTAPDEGMHLVVFGALDVFTGRTELQLVVRAMQAQGDGLWRKAFDEVKAKLAADGLLDEGRRRPLPFFPRRVAVVTSPDGAALQDILSVGRRRNPLVEFVLVPAQVQGQDAARSLRLALERCYRWGQADLIILGRGGGSREDLWCFNDESLARKVAASPVPIISAVGHEVDFTICDLVADFRAPTPSAAAERAVPVLADLHREVRRLGRRLVDDAQGLMGDRRRSLGNLAQRARLAATALGDRRRLTLQALSGRLHALSPLAILGRGYVAASDLTGDAVRSVHQVAPGDALRLRFADGTALSDVRSVTPDDNGAR